MLVRDQLLPHKSLAHVSGCELERLKRIHDGKNRFKSSANFTSCDVGFVLACVASYDRFCDVLCQSSLHPLLQFLNPMLHLRAQIRQFTGSGTLPHARTSSSPSRSLCNSMASRLAVVLVQSNPSDLSKPTDDELLNALIFEKGLDAAAICPLQNIQIDSTDQLCLLGIKGSMLLMSRSPMESIAEHLSRLQIEGRLTSLISPSNAIQIGQSVRSIYFDRIEPGSAVASKLKNVQSLRESLSKSVFSIQIAGKPILRQLPVTNLSANRETTATKSQPVIEPSIPKIESDLDLDKLLDELDASSV
jgi:hypothetical protein